MQVTDADHSIAFNKTVLRSYVVAWRDGRAGPSRCVTTQPRNETVPHGCLAATLCTLWSCDLDLWPFDLILINGRGVMMDYPCAKFGDFGLSRFGFIVLSCAKTDTQTESQKRMFVILSAGVNSKIIYFFDKFFPPYTVHRTISSRTLIQR